MELGGWPRESQRGSRQVCFDAFDRPIVKGRAIGGRQSEAKEEEQEAEMWKTRLHVDESVQ